MVYAQTPIAEPTSLAPYIPSSAGMVITIRNLAEVDRSLDRANAWPLLTLLAGGQTGNQKPFDVRSAVRDFFDSRNASVLRDQMGTELAVVASSLRRLDEAVWVVRLPREDVLRNWFPKDRRIGTSADGPTPVFRTKNGLFVAERGGVAVMGRQIDSGSLLRDAMRLVLNRGGRSNAALKARSDSTSDLPSKPLAVVEFRNRDGGSGASAPALTFWPAVKRLVVGMYAGDGQLDLAIRTTLTRPMAGAPLSRATIRHFRELPETTLFALATVADIDPRFSAAKTTAEKGTLERYLTLLAGFRDPAVMGTDSFPRVGPQLVLVWGQDLTEQGGTPQVAVLAECSNAQALAHEVDHIVGNLLKVVNAIGGVEDGAGLAIERRTRLGIRISSVPVRRFVAQSDLPWVDLLSGTELSWAVLGDWFICALTREHLERIIDAHHGLLPTLNVLPEVNHLRAVGSHRSSLAVLRAELAADVLDRWLYAYETGSPSLLDPSWWEKPGQGGLAQRRYYGIRMSRAAAPCSVVVEDVEQGTVAWGKIQSGDTILGIDGKLLSLSASKADLCRRLAESKGTPGVTLRVIRDGEALDVALRRPAEDRAASERLVEPAEALRELASLGRSVELVTFTALAPEGTRYSARLSLRFVPPPPE